MIVTTNIFGLVPVVIDQGVGPDVAKHIAAAMRDALLSLTRLRLLVALPCT
jgi:Cu(I)/Ag(I) efflux system membrane protein CusA/SilA